MRSFLRAAVAAVALVSVMSAVPAITFAQTPKQGQEWVAVPLDKIPAKVTAAYKKAYPTAKVTKAETRGAGNTAVFHLTVTGAKVKDLRIDATGKLLK